MNNYCGCKKCDKAIVPNSSSECILNEVKQERFRQDVMWGQQAHTPEYWLAIAAEELGEVAKAIQEKGWANYREECIQLAAVMVAMVECYDKQRNKSRG